LSHAIFVVDVEATRWRQKKKKNVKQNRRVLFFFLKKWEANPGPLDNTEEFSSHNGFISQ
jgi:hypothetical protein